MLIFAGAMFDFNSHSILIALPKQLLIVSSAACFTSRSFATFEVAVAFAL
jgi:hypothetical protein